MSLIKGVDISNNNGSVNIINMYTAGIEACIMKATENISFKDSYFKGFYNTCKMLKMKTGAYHFFRNGNPEQQAQNFYEAIKDKQLDVLVLDVEYSFSQLNEYVSRFLLELDKYTSQEVILYTYTGFLPHLDIKTLKLFKKVWIANYNNIKDIDSVKNSTITSAGLEIVGHQYSDSDYIGGFRGDFNVFTENMFSETLPEGKWKVDSTGWWFQYEDGSYPTDWARLPKGNSDNTPAWFLFNEKGYMLTSWQRDKGHWYYLDEANGDMKTGWHYDKKVSKWYYLDENGVMQTGWLKYNNEWYYLNSDGSMATGWIKDKDKDYLLYSSGIMAHDTTAYGYKFDSNGVANKI